MYGNGATAQAYATEGGRIQANTAGPSPSVIRDATEAVRGAQARVDTVVQRLRYIADEAFGSVPTGKQDGGQIVPPTCGKADDLRRATTVLHDTIGILEQEAERLALL